MKLSNGVRVSKYYYCAVILILAFFIIIGYIFQAHSAPAESTNVLPAKIDALISKYELEKSNIAIRVTALPGDKTVYEINPDAQMMVASNTKLFSTAAALCKLGPDFKFNTSLSYDGVITGNSLQGNLVVFSNGDPNISGRFYNNNPTAIFEEWADKLTQSGVKEVGGNLILDQSAFDRECILPSWPQEQLSYWYCAPISAVSFNDNCVDITVLADPKNGKVRYTISPDTKYVDVSFNAKLDKKLSANRLKFSRVTGTNRINISGQASPNGIPLKEYITVDNPGLFFGTVLKETLERKGINISGEILTTDKPYNPSVKTVKIAETSTDLVQAINVVNKRSQNFYAEQILKSMAHHYQGRGNFTAGLKIIRGFLSEKVGLARNGFTISDASGLSRENRFTANQIITLLKYMHGHKYFILFRDSLNYERWNFSNLESVWTKTGYIRDALALSGYIRHGKDDYYIFSVIINDFGDSGDGQANLGLKNAENFREEFVRLLQNKK